MKSNLQIAFLLFVILNTHCVDQPKLKNPMDPNSISGLLFGYDTSPIVKLVQVGNNGVLTVNNAPTEISEGSSVSVGVNFTEKLIADAAVTVTSDNSRITVNNATSATLSFTANNATSGQNVILKSVTNNSMEQPTVNITFALLGTTTTEVIQVKTTVTKIQSIILKNSLGRILGPELSGETLTLTPGTSSNPYTVELKYSPAADTNVSLAKSATDTSNPFLTATKTSFTFTKTNYNIPQSTIFQAAATGSSGFYSSTFFLKYTDAPYTTYYAIRLEASYP